MKRSHVAVGGLGTGGLIVYILSQLSTQASTQAQRWAEHAKEDSALAQRVAKLEARADYHHGAPAPEEEEVEEAAAAAVPPVGR